MRSWFGWHDGAEEFDDGSGLPPFLEVPLSLDEALDMRARLLREERRPDYTFRPSWLPFLAGDPNRALVLDCAAGPDGPAPIHDVDVWVAEPWDAVRVPSLTAAVELWWSLTEQGIYRWDPDEESWQDNGERIPLELRTTNIV